MQRLPVIPKKDSDVDTVTLTRDQYVWLCNRDLTLEYLQRAGVNDWPEHEEALELYETQRYE